MTAQVRFCFSHVILLNLPQNQDILQSHQTRGPNDVVACYSLASVNFHWMKVSNIHLYSIRGNGWGHVTMMHRICTRYSFRFQLPRNHMSNSQTWKNIIYKVCLTQIRPDFFRDLAIGLYNIYIFYLFARKLPLYIGSTRKQGKLAVRRT